jgi:signal transduction histidine kinase
VTAVLTSIGVTLAVALGGCYAIWLLRDRSAAAILAGAVLTAVLAAGTGIVVAARQMLISDHEAAVLGASVGCATLVGTACALIMGRHVSQLAAAQAHTQADRAREQALEANRRELVALLSHDLRSPLAGIRAMVEALADHVVVDATKVADYHRAIGQEAERLTEMVDDLFELARIQRGGLVLRKQRVTLADVAAQAFSSMLPLAEARGITLTADVPEAPVEVDVRLMTRVLSNLLTNAIRHTPPGGRVRIVGSQEALTVSLAVEDECGGIPYGDLPHLFELAFQGSAARTPNQESGAGFGLAIASGIVDAHAGRIEAHNVSGGCRFAVHLAC